MRERWFGATGRRVPEIVLEGAIELDRALVLDDASDVARMHAAHLEGTPVVVRARTDGRGRRALAHGEVACVLVSDPALLDVDLARLTYG